MTGKRRLVAKTFSDMEEIAAAEIEYLGGENVKILTRAVEFFGDTELIYKINYCCRTVLKVLQTVTVFYFKSNKQFYEKIFNIEFEKYLNKKGTFCVEAMVSQACDSIFDNQMYAALLAKDAICDRFRHFLGQRPTVNKKNPDLQINIYTIGNQCFVYVDTSGESLHKRGYKTALHPAALSEVLAAGMIALSGWQKDCDFIDFMCGSGTLLIEAAMLATNTPAAYFRKNFGFMKWRNFDAKLWRKVKKDANEKIVPFEYKIRGNDIEPMYINALKENLKIIHFEDVITLSTGDFIESCPISTPSHIIINPPYGERIDIQEIENFYQNVGNVLKQNYINTVAWVLSANKSAMKNLGLRPTKKLKLFNGALECSFYKYELYEGSKKFKKQNKVEN
ncbi:MAG: class I SAM-dependent RNA methyltransferase [Bacteroidales bacterium]|nr:class I SAM-dependent RNA methyltransferase [Bacteroidales bacterium]